MNPQNDDIASESKNESARMPAVRARDVIRVLEASGFALVRSSGSHLQYRKPGHKAVVTVPQHRQKDHQTRYVESDSPRCGAVNGGVCITTQMNGFVSITA